MEFVIDIAKIYQIINSPPHIVSWELFKAGGWVFFIFVFLVGFRDLWLNWRREKWGLTLSTTLLAVDIPKNNEQTPKAVESIFAHLAGAHKTYNFVEKWIEGQFQECFSLELISINGYVQFLIRTPTQFRDLVESAIYSQYPDAEIAEVEDYTKDLPKIYPDEVWDIWGTDIIPVAPDFLPIKTYPEFEYPLTGEFMDPMSAILEQMANLRDGEQLWFQIVIKPIGQKEWTQKGVDFMNKVMGKSSSNAGRGFFRMFGGETKSMAIEAKDQVFGGYGEASGTSSFELLKLTPQEKDQIEGAERKISKIGFDCKSRMLYVARNEVMNKPKVINGFIGTIKQFNTNHLNALRPELVRTGTRAKYFYVDKRIRGRKRRIMANYKSRSNWRGSKPFVLNVEELASLWHFPIMTVKAPMVQKTESRRGEPPATVPYADVQILEKPIKKVELVTEEDQKKKELEEMASGIEEQEEEPSGEPPASLPIG